MSSIVTVAVQVETFPLTSVTVRVEVLAPTFEQLKVVGVAFNVAIAQLSLLPPSMSLAVMLALPVASS